MSATMRRGGVTYDPDTGFTTIESHGVDIFQTQPFDLGTKGTTTVKGYINFYQSSVFTNLTGHDNPANWLNGMVEQAGSLPSTFTAPSWWSDSGDYIRTLTMTWE